MVRIQNMRPLGFKFVPREIFENSEILSKIVENLKFAIWKKGALGFRRAATTKPKQIERSGTI